MLGKKTEPQVLEWPSTHKLLIHPTYPVRVGDRPSALDCHLGTQNDGGSAICGTTSHNVMGRETLQNHRGAFPCLSLDVSHAPACAKELESGVCHLPGKEGRTSE